MAQKIKLSDLVEQIQDTIRDRFEGETFWITAEITDVKKYNDKRWCFLKFIEKEGGTITAEIKGVFWATTFNAIEKFEKITGQVFSSNLEITCNVRIRFHKRFGIDLEVLDIEAAATLGKLELERQQALERLIEENPKYIRLIDGQYHTKNNRTELPIVIKNIALITAANSDGQRDFKTELAQNDYGYKFSVKEYLVQVQGDTASRLICEQLKQIEDDKNNIDVVVIVRGGGSQTDFKTFDDYELSKAVATFSVPILTGIGHDRNTSIVDLMARQHKTPTKVASFIVERNMSFESAVEELKERFFLLVERLLSNAKDDLNEMQRVVKSSSPATILKKGFAIITSEGKIVTDPKTIKTDSVLQTILKDEIVHSTVTKKTKNGKEFII